MSESFLAEVDIFAGNYAPKGWMLCDGQLLPIAQNQSLYSLIGTVYGGDGTFDFALPNLVGRAPMHAGNGPGLSSYALGQRGGIDNVTLSVAQMPSHSHDMLSSTEDRDDLNPDGNYFGLGAKLYATPNNLGAMNSAMLPDAGGSQSHTNQQPYLKLTFIISVAGIYPSRP